MLTQSSTSQTLTTGTLTPSSSSLLTTTATTSASVSGLTAEYFDNADFTNRKLVRTDSTVDFLWYDKSPSSTIAPDTFSARWTGQVQPLYSEEYTFLTIADGGARLWVNNQLIINDWQDTNQLRKTYGRIALRAGERYDIRLEYMEQTGNAIIRLGWLSARQQQQVISSSQLTTTTGTVQTVFEGNSSANTLDGNAANNTLRGFAGNDILRGYDGDDVFFGGTGNDRIEGGNGSDTVSYADTTNGVTVNLATGIANRIARVMPLGDSITFGLSADNDSTVPNVGGYRYHLWNRLQANSTSIDFVGSQSSGAASLGDKDHEGHSGQTVDWVHERVSGFLSNAKPDVVLLMLGTNDTGTADTANQIATQLGALIDRITSSSPDLTVLVSSIPPARPEVRGGAARIQKMIDYNNLIPNVVNARAGRRVHFVDIRSKLTIADITAPPADDALHPTFDGYNKISQEWYNALLQNVGFAQGTLNVDQDTLVSIENIIGSRFSDRLLGNTANNRLQGGEGSDSLTGGGGNDTFVYTRANEGGDTIADFNSGDIFEISASGFGSGLIGGRSLSTTAAATGVFVNGTAAISNQATFLYSNGVLRFDADGNGAGGAVVLARLQNGPATLSANQIRIV